MEVELEMVVSIHAVVRARVKLGRPAPFCQSPDSPAYADSGDPGEFELVSVQPSGETLAASLTDAAQRAVEAACVAYVESGE